MDVLPSMRPLVSESADSLPMYLLVLVSVLDGVAIGAHLLSERIPMEWRTAPFARGDCWEMILDLDVQCR